MRCFIFLLFGALVSSCSSTPAFRDASGQVIAGSVARFEWLDVNGTRQSVLLRGRRRHNPVLILLHGGPGASETPFFRLYNAELEDHFLVAYWDQRGAGRSYRNDIPPHTMRIEQFVADLDVVVDALRQRFGQRRVVLLGHSWGSALGVLYAQRHPDKVLAYLGTGQIANVPRAELLGYRFAMRRAREEADAEALRALAAIGEPPHQVKEMLVSRRWVEAFGGSFYRKADYVRLVLAALGLPETTLHDLFRFWKGNSYSLRMLWPQLRGLDLASTAQCLEVPVTFLLGRHDWQVPSIVARDYFKLLRAPSKELIWFEHSAHNVPFEEPRKFNREVVRAVRGAMTARASPSFADATCPA